jgi:hypothetical protein
MHFRGCSIILALALSACSPGLIQAAVIVSEIMFNPQGTDLDTTVTPNISREWGEIYNTGAAAVDLTGWQFGDAQDNQWGSPFPAGTTLGPGQALVVTGDAATFDANWGTGINRIQVNTFPIQANTPGTNEAAAIRNSLGVVQDFVRYQDPGWPTANGSDGNSIFLLPNALSAAANDSAASWRPSAHGAYGARWVRGGGQGENHGSPGFVATVQQAPFAPSPDAAWSMVILPDTQNYVKNTRDLPVFFDQANWIKDNRDLFKIQLVMQEGDFVNNNDTEDPTSGNQTGDQQWANGRQVMSILDGHVPYIIAAGNHDIGFTNADNRDTQLNDYFQPSQNPLNDPAQGGILRGMFQPGHLENAYFELHAPDGRDLLIFSLEFWPRQAVISWANQIASQPQYQDHTAVLLTHSYMDSDEDYWDVTAPVAGLGTDGNDGIEMWNELVKLHGNFEMTFNGHIGGDGVGFKRSTGVEGNTVHQMLIDTQFETNGGNGWLRLVEFLEDGKTVRIRTYSPWLDMTRTTAAHQFQLVLSQLPMTPGDFNADGLVDNLDLAAWQSHLGKAAAAARTDGDADADGDVDGADFLAWQTNLGAAPTTAVPEPAAMLLTALALAATLSAAHRRPS